MSVKTHSLKLYLCLSLVKSTENGFQEEERDGKENAASVNTLTLNAWKVAIVDECNYVPYTSCFRM